MKISNRTEHSYFFTVEEDCEWLICHVDFRTSLATWRIFILRDPSGQVRYQHLDVNSPRTAVIHQDPTKTSMNGVAGKISAGQWRIDFANKPDPDTFDVHYEAGRGSLSLSLYPRIPDPNRDLWTDTFNPNGHFVYNRYNWDRVYESGGRWYKGDTHLHTVQSDGLFTPEEVNHQAQEAGLDYIVATDHNILPTSWPASDLLVIPGMEITTRPGHWNALGPRSWLDWHPHSADGGMTTEEGNNRLLRDAAEAGAVCSISHPRLEGFKWTYHMTDLSALHAIEVINCPEHRHARPGNEEALMIWNTLWNDGRRLTGIGGSDFHNHHGRIGRPTTCVFAQDLSARAILDGIRTGHVYVTAGPELDAIAMVDGSSHLPGSDVTESVDTARHASTHLRVAIKGMDKGELHWIENGKMVQRETIVGDGVFEAAFQWRGADYAWARAEVRGEDGELLAFTNPVFYGARTPRLHTWEQVVRQSGLTMPGLNELGERGW